MRGAATAARLAAVAALVTACAAPAAPTGLAVALEQSRDNENRHLLQVVFTNDGSEPVEVVRLQLRSPAFTGVPPTVRPDVLGPGRRIAFPVTYGLARCDRRGAAEVVVGHRTPDGLRETVLRVPAQDPTLPRLHRRECALAELARAVSIGFAPEWERRGDAAHGRLVLRRVGGDAPVRLTGVEGSVLLTLRPTAPLPATLTGAELSVPVVVTASRCDPHALTESKRTYDFPWYVALGDAPPLYGTARPPEPGRSVLEQVLLATCRAQNG